MATFKAEVYAHQKKQDGTYNIKIRVTHLGKKKYLATPYFVTAQDLTRNLKLKNYHYIDLCDDIIKGYRHKCELLGLKINDLDVAQLVEYLTTREQAFRLDFNQWVRECIEREIKEGRQGTARIGCNALLSWLGFLDSDNIDINDINRQMATQFVDYLSIKLKPTTIHSYMGELSKFFNMAIDTYNDDDDKVRSNPFHLAKLPRIGNNKKKALTIEQIRQIRDFPATGMMELARDAFMLSFYLIGMNAADMLTATDLHDGFLTYNRQKTKDRRKDGAEIRVKVQPEAEPLMEKYRSRFGGLVFCFGEKYKHRSFNSIVLAGIKRICAQLGFDASFYSARHSWATIAANNGIDIYTIHLALNHVSREMEITETYIKRDFTAINDANRKVLDLLL